MLVVGTPNAQIQLGTGIASEIRLNQELLDALSDVHKQRLLRVQDLTAQLNLPPQFPVATGGYSDVYRGTLRILNAEKQVAVKVLRIHNEVEREQVLKRLCRETLVLSGVDHSLVAKFYGLAVVNKCPAIVLEWYNLGAASNYLRDKSAHQKLEIVQDIARGLQHLHSQNIIHGDLKGSNVLITNERHGVLTDFGLSRIFGASITTTSVAGSIRWLSPELVTPWLRIQNPIPCTKASDVWAFGCTAIELLSGDVPYSELDGKTLQAIPDTIRRGVLPFHPS